MANFVTLKPYKLLSMENTLPIAPVRTLTTEFLMEVRVNLQLQIIGDTPNGHRRIYHITGGRRLVPILKARYCRAEEIGSLSVPTEWDCWMSE